MGLRILETLNQFGTSDQIGLEPLANCLFEALDQLVFEPKSRMGFEPMNKLRVEPVTTKWDSEPIRG